MDPYTYYPPGREPRRPRSSIPLIFAALALAGALPGSGHGFRRGKVMVETDDERQARWDREAAKRERDSADAIAAAQAKREKREARRRADIERTLRQQGRL